MTTSTDEVLWGQSQSATTLQETKAVDADTMVDCWSLPHSRRVAGSEITVLPGHVLPTFRFRLRKRVPVFPSWLIQGLLGPNGIYSHGEDLEWSYDGTEPTSLTIPTAQWMSDSETAHLRETPDSRPAFLPISSLFETENGKLVDRSPTWYSEAALFTRWGIYGQAHGKPIHRDAFWKFVDKATSGSVTEATFRDCFGFGYAEMDAELTRYLSVAISDLIKREVSIELYPKLPALRDATQFEVGRIVGDWERIEGNSLKHKNPELSQKFLDEASRRLLKPFNNGNRDPQLLGALGLCEFAIDREHAAKYLEEAVQLHVLRPSVYIRLAQLRYESAMAHPSGPNEHFGAEQLAYVLDPLFLARQQPPAMVDTYRLIAKAWSRSAIRPTKEHLGVLDEGLKFFWSDTELASDVHELRSQWGYELPHQSDSQ
jgi:hypothetical protein